MKILIVKTSALGDIVHSFDALAFLKAKFPEAQIDWVVERPLATLVAAHPYVNKAICMDSKLWRKSVNSSSARKELGQFIKHLRQEYYDIIFDLQSNMKSGVVTLLARGKEKVGYSWSGVSEWPNLLCTNTRIKVPKNLSVREDYLYLVRAYAGALPFKNETALLKLTTEEQEILQAKCILFKSLNKPLVMICHGSNWKNKQLSEESLASFLNLLQSYLGAHLIFTWGNEKERREALALHNNIEASSVLEKVSLPLLQHLMAHMKLVVAMDSLPLHLAATTGTKTFSVFGASLANRYAPRGEQHLFYQGSCPYQRQFETRCPILRTCPTGACIRAISGEELFAFYLNHF